MGVSILPGARSPLDLIGAMIGQNISNVLPGAVQQGYNRGQLQTSLDEISKMAKSGSSSPLDITLAAMKAGAGIPGSERYLGQLIPMLTKMAEANASQNTPLAGEQPNAPRNRQAVEPVSERPQLPGFMGQKEGSSQFFPTNLGTQGGPGNVPQQATSGAKVPLLTPSEKINDAKRLAKERTSQAFLLQQKKR